MEDFGNDASGYRHDEPELAGWASAGSAPRWIREGYLWSGDGSSLPFLRVGPGDVPNVALLFEGRVPTPRPPWWYFLSPLSGRSPMFVGGRAVGGVLVRLRDPQAAASAFEEWGVVRRITAEDVLEKGLLVAKPLRGWRIVAYAVLFLGPVLVDLVLRRW